MATVDDALNRSGADEMTPPRPTAITAAGVLLIVAGADAMLAGVWFFGTLVLGHGGPCGFLLCGFTPLPFLAGAALLREGVCILNGGSNDVTATGLLCLVIGTSCSLPVGLFGYETITIWQADNWGMVEGRFREVGMVLFGLGNAVAVAVAGVLLRRHAGKYVVWKVAVNAPSETELD